MGQVSDQLGRLKKEAAGVGTGENLKRLNREMADVQRGTERANCAAGAGAAVPKPSAGVRTRLAIKEAGRSDTADAIEGFSNLVRRSAPERNS